MCVLAGNAAADDDTDKKTDPPAAITGQLDEATATFRVRYARRVAAGLTTAAAPELPANGIIVGGTAAGHALALVPAAQADESFDALTEQPATAAQAWAFAVSNPSQFAQLAIAAPRATTIDYELAISAPTCFSRDVRYVAVPDAWASVLPAAQRVPAARQRELDVSCTGSDTEKHTWAAFASGDLAKHPPGAARIGGVSSRVQLGDLHVASVEVALAGRLSEVPADLATVLVLDGSRSMTTAQLEAQRELVASYLRAVPTSRVQALVVTRDARPLLASWTSAASAAPVIDRELRALARRNGSNLDAGLREAATWLARQPGTHRIVLVGDEHLAAHVARDPRGLAALAGKDTLVHVVRIADGSGLERDDRDELAPLAAATRGMAVRAGVAELDATMLVRPVALDHAKLATPGWKAVEVPFATCPDEMRLVEGSSCRWFGKTAHPDGPPIVLTGMMWGDRVTRVIRPEPSRARELARELSAMRVLDGHYNQLADAAAQAVNPAWSLYGTWGGTGGYPGAELTYGLEGGVSDWGTTSADSASGTNARRGPDLAPALRTAIAGCVEGKHAAVAATVETTLEEIVDVSVQTPDPALGRCVEDALWNAWLVVQNTVEHATTRVEVPAS